MALRLFMDAFRPPGEGQKIDRIMQASTWGRQGAQGWVGVCQALALEDGLAHLGGNLLLCVHLPLCP